MKFYVKLLYWQYGMYRIVSNFIEKEFNTEDEALNYCKSYDLKEDYALDLYTYFDHKIYSIFLISNYKNTIYTHCWKKHHFPIFDDEFMHRNISLYIK